MQWRPFFTSPQQEGPASTYSIPGCFPYIAPKTPKLGIQRLFMIEGICFAVISVNFFPNYRRFCVRAVKKAYFRQNLAVLASNKFWAPMRCTNELLCNFNMEMCF